MQFKCKFLIKLWIIRDHCEVWLLILYRFHFCKNGFNLAKKGKLNLNFLEKEFTSFFQGWFRSISASVYQFLGRQIWKLKFNHSWKKYQFMLWNFFPSLKHSRHIYTNKLALMNKYILQIRFMFTNHSKQKN